MCGILDDYEVVTRGSGLVIPMPRGMTVSPLVTPEKGILWPMFVPAPRGRPHVVRYDPPREVAVLLPEGRAPGDVLSIECFEDHSWTPEVDPLRIDAWRGSFRARWVPDGRVLDVVPPVPFHCLVQFRECFVYRYVAEKDASIDLRKPFGSKRVHGRPLVDGSPVPEGTVLLPGRIDLATLEILADPGMPYRVHRAGSPAEPWADVCLPAADWLTAWHPKSGLAHLEWRDLQAPEGRTYPGVILVTAPPGFAVEGTVSAYPVWKGT